MRDLLTFSWSAFDARLGLRVVVGILVMAWLSTMTGASWFASGFTVLLAALTLLPGTTAARLGGIGAYALGASAVTLGLFLAGPGLWPNVGLIALVGWLGTVVLLRSVRLFMVGFAVISWAIYAPPIVQAGVGNALLAIGCGTLVLALLTLLTDAYERKRGEVASAGGAEMEGALTARFVHRYAALVAVMLAVTTWLGWAGLQTDPTLVTGGAFYVLGFDVRKTWIAGLARAIGVAAGAILGYAVGDALDAGTATDVLALVGCFLTFAAMGVHPGAFMFFLVFSLSLTWPQLDEAAGHATFTERLLGEGVGIAIALLAVGALSRFSRAGAAGTGG